MEEIDGTTGAFLKTFAIGGGMDRPYKLTFKDTVPDRSLNLVVCVADLNLQQGIENSLDAKLDTALSALDDVNDNNDQAACNSLEAFINAVEAQGDKKITSEDADNLIGKAHAIIDLICPQ